MSKKITLEIFYSVLYRMNSSLSAAADRCALPSPVLPSPALLSPALLSPSLPSLALPWPALARLAVPCACAGGHSRVNC